MHVAEFAALRVAKPAIHGAPDDVASHGAGIYHHRMPNRSELWIGAVSYLVLHTGCVVAPGIPGGPLQGTGVQGTVSAGFGIAPGKVTQTAADGSEDTGSDPATNAVNGPLVSRVGGRVGLIDWVDVGGDVGWTDGGYELRAGVPEWTWVVPFALSFAQRSGQAGLANDYHRLHDTRWRLELYPRVYVQGTLRVHLVAALGTSAGLRYHGLPYSYDFPMEDITPNEGPAVNTGNPVFRKERRFEAALGAELRRRRLIASLVILPYWVQSSGEAEYEACLGCTSFTLEQNSGVAVFLSAGVSYTLFRATGGERKERAGAELAR